VFRNEGGPVDEYDDLIQPILHALASCPSSSALAEELQQVMVTDYGLNPSQEACSTVARELLTGPRPAQ